MIPQAVNNWNERNHELREKYSKERPSDYTAIVTDVIKLIADDEYEGFSPDYRKIHVINDGDYQGTLLFIIPENEYQPSKYYSLFVNYGSCSGCDTLQAIQGWDDDEILETEVEGYMKLALHMVQGLKVIGGNND